MTDWLRHIKRWSLWDAVSTAQRGAISRWVTLWTVLCCSIMAVWVVWRVFGDSPPDVPMGTATAFTGFTTGCLAGAWGFYRWARGDRSSHDE